MGYLHIDNLYKNQTILLFRRCYALEKVHGTSAHLRFNRAEVDEHGDTQPARLTFFAGGEKHERFVNLFDRDLLLQRFEALGFHEVTVFGEAYGGKQQGMRATYGDELAFIVFDVRVGKDRWLNVPEMAKTAETLGLESVPYEEVSTELVELDARRDAPSEVAVRRGTGSDKRREGVILRPLVEMLDVHGNRIITKHKQEAFSERASPQKIVDPSQLKVLEEANAIADEWVTPMRLTHVLDKLGNPSDISATPAVLSAMQEDVYREASKEIVESKAASAAIAKRAAKFFHERIKSVK